MANFYKMDILMSVFITFVNVHLISGAKLIDSEICTPLDGKQHCYSLYGGSDEVETFTWNDAQTACSGSGGQLVRITSSSIQDILVKQVMPRITGVGGTVHVWTAGKRSEDITWYTTTDESLSADITDKFVGITGPDMCGAIKDWSSTRPLDDSPCQYELMRVLCQRTASTCTTPDISYSGFCYHLYYDSRKLDWNRARQYCRSEPNRDLAYSHFTDAGLLSQLATNDTNDNNPLQNTWIGASSRKWIWDVTNGPDTTMTYTNFRGGITDGKCVYIDPNDGGKWDAVPCDDLNSNFICEIIKDVPPVTPAPTTAPSPEPTSAVTAEQTTGTSASTSTSEPTVSSSNSGTAQPSVGNEPVLEQKYIIGIAVAGGVLLVIVIIAVTIVVTRGNRKMTDDDDTPAYNSHIESGSTTALNYGAGGNAINVYTEPPEEGDTNAMPAQYAELDEDGGLVQGGPKGVSKGYKTAPQGDIYSLPNKNNKVPSGAVYENS